MQKQLAASNKNLLVLNKSV